MAILFVVLDGIGDVRWQGRGTPLEEASTPALDALAREGALGLHHTVGRGKVVGSDIGHLALFGYSEADYPGRGPLEALGAGIPLKKGDIAFRVNLAYVEGGIVKDRRAGRPPTALGKAFEDLLSMEVEGFSFLYKHTTEHRGVLVVRGPTKGWVGENDPHKVGRPYTYPKAEDKALERALSAYLQRAHQLLSQHPLNREREREGKPPANALLLRGAGTMREVAPFERKHGLRAAAIAGGALYKGVARYVGMDVIEVEGATGDKHTNLKAKAQAALSLRDYDFVFLHVKATDSFGHDGDFEGKKAFIERVDRELIASLATPSTPFSTIVVTGDHSTPWPMKAHSGHAVPVLLHSSYVRQDETKAFSEYEAAKGALGHMLAKDIIEMAKACEGRQEKVGS